MLEVFWKNKITSALGRNGNSRCIGIEILETSEPMYEGDLLKEIFDIVEISPLNTRSGVTRCHIDIPIESIPDVIKALEKAYQTEKFFEKEKI